ncbi:lytic transglycosylase domain-containing protein [Kitasatospora fiedleri]|uniref:lytic transglycosylase domain-containing protein n=1 Tax=Kitasatospora fiedleri TaxID=2991545 RepID=UPI00249B783F|nr:transglycosylase SLT domain-containing protein [Kitasatospora fiedleri]
MATDIVGTVGVDVIPVLANFHERLKAAVIPAADRVGAEAGRGMGDRFSEALRARVAGAFSEAINAAGQKAKGTATRQGDETAGAFARSLKAKLEVAFRSMPKLDVAIGSAGADTELARLRAKIEQLSGKRVGIDISAADADAKVADLDARLRRLGESHPNPTVRVDVATARAALAEVRAEIAAIDGKTARATVRVDTGPATGSILALGLQIAALAAIPAIPVLAAGVGGVASAFVAGGAAAGAFGLAAIPAVRGVAAAMQAQTAAQNESTSATNAGANAAVTAKQRALTLAGAQQTLAAAQRNAAQSVASAQQQAARQVETASRSLADAQRAETQAQDDLTAARRTAEQQLASYEDKLRDGALSERDAQLRVLETQQALQAATADGSTATQLDRQRAQLDYDRAQQGAKEAAQAQRDLTAEAQAAQAAGVEGSDAVRQAQDKLTQAQQRAVDAAKAVADAQKAGAEAVASAQRSAAESVASAQRGVQQAMLSTEKSTASATSAQDKYREALAKLSPPARALYDAIAGPRGLKGAFSDWSVSMQPRVLPLFVRGVDAAKASLPGLTPLVIGASDAVGTLFDKASAELKSPFWKRFKADIDASAGPALLGLGTTFGNVLKGMSGIVDAFLPHMAGIDATMERITGRFAKWGSGLRGSPEFERFLDYAERSGPQLASTFGKIASAVLSVGQALAPLSGPVLQAVGWVADGIGWVADHAPEAVAGIYALVFAMNAARLALIAYNVVIAVYEGAVLLATLAQYGWDAAIDASGVVPLIEAIVVALVALVVGVVYAYDHWNWFHVAVVAAWNGIKVAALFAWDYVLKPTFAAIWTAMQFVGSVAMWLWQNAIGPAFEAIWTAARVLFAVLVVAVFAPIWIGIQAVGAIAVWLWSNAIGPVFGWIGDKAVWLWDKILRPFFGGCVDAFKGLMVVAVLLWEGAIKPVFGWIGDKASWLWSNALRPAFEKIKEALQPFSGAFTAAKDLIGKAWDELYDITKKPINFVIEWVYTKGIKAVWDKVADFVDLPHMPDAPKLLAAGGTVGNGWGPAVPMVTNRPTAIVGEGNPAYPEYVIPTDPKYRSRAIALHAAAGSQLLASGGILGDAWSGITSLATSAWSAAQDGFDLIRHPSEAWEKLTQPVRDLIAKIGKSQMAKTVAGIPIKAVSGLKDMLLETIGLGGAKAPKGGGGVQQWTSVVHQALSLIGQPESWTDTVLRRMNQESGGDPNIVNRWDSNWKAGTPSVGLMQVIGPTFRAYADQFRDKGPFLYGTSVDPLANTFAGLNYAVHQYGSLSALNRPGGYDSGGYLPTGTSLVYNHTGRPEPVFTSGQWDAIQRLGSGGGTAPAIEAHVYVGDREITDIVRVEVRSAHDAVARDLISGVK